MVCVCGGEERGWEREKMEVRRKAFFFLGVFVSPSLLVLLVVVWVTHRKQQRLYSNILEG